MDNNQDKQQEKDNRKPIWFYIDEDTHARLRIQLKYDNITQTMFFNYIVKGYLENDKHMRDYMNFILSELYSKRVNRNRRRDKKEEQKQIEDFNLNEDEIENIFDILESENPDL